MFMEIKIMIENSVDTKENVKKGTKSLGFKICLGLIIAMLVIVLVIVGTFAGLSFTVNHSDKDKANSIMTNTMLMIMPKSIKAVDGSNIKFYVEKNEDYNPETDAESNNIRYYYIDSNGDKQYLENGVYTMDNGKEMQVAVGFLIKTNANMQILKNVVTTVSIFAGIIFFGLIIWLSYYIWLDFEMKKEANGNKKQVKSKR